MRLLLDENLPKRLKQDFSSHEVFTIREKGWNGLKNGLLLEKGPEDECADEDDQQQNGEINSDVFPLDLSLVQAPEQPRLASPLDRRPRACNGGPVDHRRGFLDYRGGGFDNVSCIFNDCRRFFDDSGRRGLQIRLVTITASRRH